MAEVARAAGKPQYVLEKDYGLSYLIAGIAAVPALAGTLVFKGGTCLRKAYFPGYRFSEDLDYTSRTPLECERIFGWLKEAVDHTRARLLAFGPFEISVAQVRHREPHPRGQCEFIVRIQFPWMRSADCRLKIEVSPQEPLLAEAVERRLIHEFPGEALGLKLAAYRLEEIASEKLRALLQSREHLRDRGWLRNRPRDLYDLWRLWTQRDFLVDWELVRGLVPRKAEAIGLSFQRAEDFLDPQVIRGIERDWNAQLSIFVDELPTFDLCQQALRAILRQVVANGP